MQEYTENKEDNINSLYSGVSGKDVDFSKINYDIIKYYSMIAYNFLYAYCEYCVDHHIM